MIIAFCTMIIIMIIFVIITIIFNHRLRDMITIITSSCWSDPSKSCRKRPEWKIPKEEAGKSHHLKQWYSGTVVQWYSGIVIFITVIHCTVQWYSDTANTVILLALSGALYPCATTESVVLFTQPNSHSKLENSHMTERPRTPRTSWH